MPFWDENAAYCPLIGQKPPPPPRVDGGAMHIYNICMLMQRHNRKKANLPVKKSLLRICKKLQTKRDQEAVPMPVACSSSHVHLLPPSLASTFFYLDTPRLSHSVSHLGDTWLEVERSKGLLASSCLRQAPMLVAQRRGPQTSSVQHRIAG
ncbi:hypothetical protein CFAM422_009080 [Trichoderma lentiforme]|uniref:Uncharacterized protein n=1 Tax=Trichoderma lentiforme TaxID=1567552 RepID=A0A9P5CB36_9HYPO|nr:hypothetical protein CFAM422_009080 [Trichoderma lentiforme]